MSRSARRTRSRSAPSFLARCARIARQAGADRLRLADTVGVWNPFQTHAMFVALPRAAAGLALGFHGHNDLGMATANTLAAAMAGPPASTLRSMVWANEPAMHRWRKS